MNLIGEGRRALFIGKKLMYKKTWRRVLLPILGFPCKLRVAGPDFTDHYTLLNLNGIILTRGIV